MIEAFKDEGTKDIFRGCQTKAARKVLPIQLHAIARRKLAVISYADDLDMLRIPPSNHLEDLKGDRTGQYSIRINGQYRICFSWIGEKAVDVEIADYH